MSVLDRHARKPKSQPYDKTVATKLTENEYERFKEHCEERGLSVSNAIRLLILNELDPPPVVERRPVYESSSRRPSSSTGKGRFTIGAYTINGELPCPICGNWHTTTNYSRHASTQHDKSTEQLLTENMETVQAMIVEKRGF